jgi:hypothetical protein
VPSPVNPPPGCHFHTRCPHARALCAQQAPLLEDIDGQADGLAAQTVACHFWRELPLPASLPAAPAPTPAKLRLARLQSAFVSAPPGVPAA